MPTTLKPALESRWKVPNQSHKPEQQPVPPIASVCLSCKKTNAKSFSYSTVFGIDSLIFWFKKKRIAYYLKNVLWLRMVVMFSRIRTFPVSPIKSVMRWGFAFKKKFPSKSWGSDGIMLMLSICSDSEILLYSRVLHSSYFSIVLTYFKSE